MKYTIYSLDDTDRYHCANFKDIFKELQHMLIEQKPVNVGEWQSQKLDDNPMTHMRELMNISITMPLPTSDEYIGLGEALAEDTGAHLPWAEDHFQERVSGEPLNPPPSNEWWPFAQKNNTEHKSEGEAFSHTYPERMWPKWAGPLYEDMSESISAAWEPMRGIRFYYGDLDDVISLLRHQPNTRQAFLPIWFPEDTGVVHGKRVPCTLGYHFLIRERELQITYYMRSCDLLRHFQDDVYMAGRLAQFVAKALNTNEFGYMKKPQFETKATKLIMHIANLHVFNGDVAMMEYRDKKGLAWNE